MTLMLRPYRLGSIVWGRQNNLGVLPARLVPYRLGAETQLTAVDGSGLIPAGGITPIPMPYTAPVDVTPAATPPRPGMVPCGIMGRMQPSGVSPMVWCNPDGSAYVQASAAPAIASVPTSDGQTPVNNPGAPSPAGPTVVLTPTSGPIPPPNTPMIAPPANFLTSSLLFGIPNWVLLGGAALLLLGGKK